MSDIETIVGAGGGGGFVGAILTFFGIKWKVDRIDKDLQSHKKTVVYTDVFEATMEPVKEDIKTIKQGMEKLLINSVRTRSSNGKDNE